MWTEPLHKAVKKAEYPWRSNYRQVPKVEPLWRLCKRRGVTGSQLLIWSPQGQRQNCSRQHCSTTTLGASNRTVRFGECHRAGGLETGNRTAGQEASGRTAGPGASDRAAGLETGDCRTGMRAGGERETEACWGVTRDHCYYSGLEAYWGLGTRDCCSTGTGKIWNILKTKTTTAQ